jgi:hypothetical protein
LVNVVLTVWLGEISTAKYALSVRARERLIVSASFLPLKKTVLFMAVFSPLTGDDYFGK